MDFTWISPDKPITRDLPPQELLEKDKFANNGWWFGQNVRHRVDGNFNYNFDASFSGMGYSYPCCDAMVEDFQFYYGEQKPNILAHIMQLPKGGNIHAVYVPGQDVRRLIDHMGGNLIEMVEPFKNTISAKGLSEKVVKSKNEYWNLVELRTKLASRLKDVADTLSVKAPNPEHNNIKDDRELQSQKRSFKDSYELAAVKISKSNYYREKLKQTFIELGMQQFIGGFSNLRIYVQNKKVKAEIIPCWASIIDKESTDFWGRDAKVGGGINLYTPSQLFAKWPQWFDTNQRQFITQMASGNHKDNQAFRTYVNAGCKNMEWWTEDGRIAVAEMVWIGRKDLQYKVKINEYGKERYWLPEDLKTYSDVKDSTGKHMKGEDIAGDAWGWDEHKCALVGNLFPVDYGYSDYLVRSRDDKSIPELSVKSFCHGKRMGYFKSIASRLKMNQVLRDTYKVKIQEKVGFDIGIAYWLNALKTGKSMLDVMQDFRTNRLSARNVTSGEVDDNEVNKQPTAEKIDLGLQADVQYYLELLREERAEMEALVNIPAMALGMQTDVQGKGVQDRTIAQSTKGQKGFYDGLMEYYQMILQYMFDVSKMVYTEDGDFEGILPISDDEVEVLTLSKDYTSEEMNIYILPNDAIEAEKKTMLSQFIQAISQNAKDWSLWGIGPDDVLAMMKMETFDQGIEDLQISMNKNQAKNQLSGAAQMQQQQQLQKDWEIFKTSLQAKLDQQGDDNANFREMIKAFVKTANDIASVKDEQPPKSPLEAENQPQPQQQAAPVVQ